jgi:DNA-binding transcriptional LysR family regulator
MRRRCWKIKNNALADLFRGDALSGRLRITASAGFGRKIVAPMLTRFMQQHPALQVDLLATDEQVDIVGKGIDVALRIALLRDNRLVAHRLCHNLAISAPARRILPRMAIQNRLTIWRHTAV